MSKENKKTNSNATIYSVGKRFLNYIVLFLSLLFIIPLKIIGLQKSKWYNKIYNKYLSPLHKWLS